MFDPAPRAVADRGIAHQAVSRRLQVDVRAQFDVVFAFDAGPIVGEFDALCPDHPRLARAGLPRNLNDALKRTAFAGADVFRALGAHRFTSLIRMSALHGPKEQFDRTLQVGSANSYRLLFIYLHSPDNLAHISRVGRPQIAAALQAKLAQMLISAIFAGHFEIHQHPPEDFVEDLRGDRVH